MIVPFQRILITSLSLAAIVACGSAHGGDAPVTREELPKIIEEILMNDPTILVRAFDRLRQVQEQAAAQTVSEALTNNRDAIFSNPGNPSIGPADADVTLVEFFDYHCTYCKHFLPDLTRLLENDKKVRVIFKDLPILSEDSATAARASIAFDRLTKDRFFEFHTALMKESGPFDQTLLAGIAKGLGVDGNALESEMAKPEIADLLAENLRLAGSLGVRGTPAIIVGNQMVSGAMPYEALKKLVDDERSSGQSKN
jgi:protein-disulfide isomerase